MIRIVCRPRLDHQDVAATHGLTRSYDRSRYDRFHGIDLLGRSSSNSQRCRSCSRSSSRRSLSLREGRPNSKLKERGCVAARGMSAAGRAHSAQRRFPVQLGRLHHREVGRVVAVENAAGSALERRRLRARLALVDTVGRYTWRPFAAPTCVSARADKSVADKTDMAGSSKARPSRSASVEVIGKRSV
jgi:hypothetical protein